MKRGLTTTVAYQFANGRVLYFTGMPCYVLSNSWRDAQSQAARACAMRGEPFDNGRLLGVIRKPA